VSLCGLVVSGSVQEKERENLFVWASECGRYKILKVFAVHERASWSALACVGVREHERRACDLGI